MDGRSIERLQRRNWKANGGTTECLPSEDGNWKTSLSTMHEKLFSLMHAKRMKRSLRGDPKQTNGYGRRQVNALTCCYWNSAKALLIELGHLSEKLLDKGCKRYGSTGFGSKLDANSSDKKEPAMVDSNRIRCV